MDDGRLRRDSGGAQSRETASIDQSVGQGDADTRYPSAAESLDGAPGQELRIPVIREDVVVGTREVQRGGVRVHKTVVEHEEVVDQPVTRDKVTVERVSIGQFVDAVPPIREEGDTLIIPVLEEILVVEKRLVVKEELRITRHREATSEQTRVMLREEQIHIERID